MAKLKEDLRRMRKEIREKGVTSSVGKGKNGKKRKGKKEKKGKRKGNEEEIKEKKT